SRRRHTRFSRDWSSDVCSSDLSKLAGETVEQTKAPSVPLPPDAGDGSKVSLYSESLEYLFKTIEEIGLVAILHNDMYRVEVNYRSEERRVGKECRSRWARRQ